jgi:hypothetical protein
VAVGWSDDQLHFARAGAVNVEDCSQPIASLFHILPNHPIIHDAVIPAAHLCRNPDSGSGVRLRAAARRGFLPVYT